MMRKLVLAVFTLLLAWGARGQEFDCSVSVSAPQVQGTERKVYQTMQTAIYEFMNQRVWSPYQFQKEERIECTIMITISERLSSDRFKGKINLVLRRPVYKTSYNSILFNWVDKDLEFDYIEFEPLEYNENTFSSNLTSILAFYANMFLGLDADSFSMYGGTPYFEKAQQIVNSAQNAPEKGWKAFEGRRNRYWLIENIMNSSYGSLREGFYTYHRKGLDLMSENIDMGRNGVTDALVSLQKAHRQKPGLFFLQLITESKSDELINIYTQAAPQDKTKAVNILKEIDPSHASNYQKIMQQ